MSSDSASSKQIEQNNKAVKVDMKVIEKNSQDMITGSDMREKFDHDTLTELFIKDMKNYRSKMEKKYKVSNLDEMDIDEQQTAIDKAKKEIKKEMNEQHIINKYTSVDNLDYYKKFEDVIPESIKYIKQTIFRTFEDCAYVMMTNENNFTFLKETSKQSINALLNRMPKTVSYWYDKIFQVTHTISMSLSEPLVYGTGKFLKINTFNGYKYKTFSNDQSLIEKRKDDINMVWNHMKKLLCSDDDIYFNFMQNWVSTLLCGERKLTIALYFKGLQGLGKSQIVRLFANILGRNNCKMIYNENDLFGSFNGHLLGKVLAFIDDVQLSDSKFLEFGEKMKTYITEDTISIRDLYKSSIDIPNFVSWIASGNKDIGCLNENMNGRCRWIMFNLSTKLESNEYYQKLNNLINNDEEFLNAFWLDAKNKYNKDWDEQSEVKKLPINETKQSNILKSLPQEIKFLRYILENQNKEFYNILHKRAEFYNIYENWFNKHYESTKGKIISHDLPINLSIYDGFTENKNGIKINGKSTYNTIQLDKYKLLATLKKKGYITKYELDEWTENDKYKNNKNNKQTNNNDNDSDDDEKDIDKSDKSVDIKSLYEKQIQELKDQHQKEIDEYKKQIQLLQDKLNNMNKPEDIQINKQIDNTKDNKIDNTKDTKNKRKYTKQKNISLQEVEEKCNKSISDIKQKIQQKAQEKINKKNNKSDSDSDSDTSDDKHISKKQNKPDIKQLQKELNNIGKDKKNISNTSNEESDSESSDEDKIIKTKPKKIQKKPITKKEDSDSSDDDGNLMDAIKYAKGKTDKI